MGSKRKVIINKNKCHIYNEMTVGTHSTVDYTYSVYKHSSKLHEWWIDTVPKEKAKYKVPQVARNVPEIA